MFTKKEIEEFKKITFEVYRINLSDEQAEIEGTRLITLAELMLKESNKRVLRRRIKK